MKEHRSLDQQPKHIAALVEQNVAGVQENRPISLFVNPTEVDTYTLYKKEGISSSS